MVKLLKLRLLARGYPARLVQKITATVSYEARAQMLVISKPPPPKFYPPVYKCPLPPQHKLLKLIVLKNYSCLQNIVPAPRFLSLKHKTLRNELVRAKMSPTNDQLFDIHILLSNQIITKHTIAGKLPIPRTQSVRTQRCQHPRCVTCQHLNCSKHLKCTRTGIVYTLRHNFSCTSNHLIYNMH